MTRSGTLIARLAVVSLLGVTAVLGTGTESAAGGLSAGERLKRFAREPLTDPDAGRLYEPALALLEAARSLPRRLEFGPPATAAAPAVAAAPAAEPAAPEESPPMLTPMWLAALAQPVVDDERLARTSYVAGEYERAAALYRGLWEKNPQEPHFLAMLVLSERNAGHREEARKLAQGLQGDARAWADWLSELDDAADVKNEVTQ